MAFTKIDRGGRVRGSRHFLLLSDEEPNDSDKSLVYEDSLVGEGAEILCLRIEYTATATAGTRQLQLRILDSSADVIFDMDIAAGNQTAGQSATIQLVSEMAPADFTRNSIDFEWMPKLFLIPGQSLQVIDRAAIDAAADDMTIHATVKIF